APASATESEVQHLLGYLEQSGCQFYRNGSWHTSQAARAHLEKKYQHLLNKGLIVSAENFIERAATGSSASGKAYQVKCVNSDAVASATWLAAELQRYRQSQTGKKP
ncbi:MAG TPA: DUF5329 domain-containing protein, partial [Burkholderiales bacterium]|nr:DUF5329 domain-containing protein [Burkholderiales bacterium]